MLLGLLRESGMLLLDTSLLVAGRWRTAGGAKFEVLGGSSLLLVCRCGRNRPMVALGAFCCFVVPFVSGPRSCRIGAEPNLETSSKFWKSQGVTLLDGKGGVFGLSSVERAVCVELLRSVCLSSLADGVSAWPRNVCDPFLELSPGSSPKKALRAFL